MTAATHSDPFSTSGQKIDARFLVRATVYAGETSTFELNGKTAMISERSIVARLVPESPEVLRHLQGDATVLLELCYSQSRQRTLSLEAGVREMGVRPGYLKIKFGLRFVHPAQADRWHRFFGQVRRKLREGGEGKDGGAR